MLNLPLFKTTYCFSSLIIDYIEGFPKKYRFTIGTELQRCSLAMFRHISYANRSRGEERKNHITNFLAEYDTSVALLRMCHDKRIITTSQAAHLMELTNSMGKQAQGWKRT